VNASSCKYIRPSCHFFALQGERLHYEHHEHHAVKQFMLLTICVCRTNENTIPCINVDFEQAEADKARQVKHKRTSGSRGGGLVCIF
jgi:hypothetical protein